MRNLWCEDHCEIGVGVCLLVVRDKKILVSERIGSFGRGYMCCPGGHQEKNERWEQTALRETAEEAGHKIKVAIRPVYWPGHVSESNIPLFVTNNILAGGKHYITIWLHAEWLSGEPINAEPSKKKGWEWKTVQEIIDDPRMQAGVAAWLDGKFHEALHWIPLPEIFKYKDRLGLTAN